MHNWSKCRWGRNNEPAAGADLEAFCLNTLELVAENKFLLHKITHVIRTNVFSHKIKYFWNLENITDLEGLEIEFTKLYLFFPFLTKFFELFVKLNFECALCSILLCFWFIKHFFLLCSEQIFCKCKSIERWLESKSLLNIHVPWKCIRRTHNTEFQRALCSFFRIILSTCVVFKEYYRHPNYY